MQETTAQISAIHKKMLLLIKHYEQLQKEHEKCQAVLEKKNDEQKKMHQDLTELTQQNLILKASLQSMEDADKKTLELKLNSFVKSLDKTIALLTQ